MGIEIVGLKGQIAETKASEISETWMTTLEVLADKYGDTFVGNPKNGFLAVRSEGLSPYFKESLGQSEPGGVANLLLTKYGPVIAWIGNSLVKFDDRTTFWQKQEVQAAIEARARAKLVESLVDGESKPEYKMREMESLELPGFNQSTTTDPSRLRHFLFVNPFDVKLGDECLKRILEIHNFYQEHEKASLEKGTKAAITMATKFIPAPTQSSPADQSSS